MPFSFMPLSFMPLSGSEQNKLCLYPLSLFPFLPLSGLMENADYAGFLYANFRAPCQKWPKVA
jgi:hypothetical protein